MLTNIEFKDEAETLALSKAVDSLQAIELRLQVVNYFLMINSKRMK